MTRSITENVKWVGLNDNKTEMFENIWPLEHGVSYNSYLIKDEKNVLVDTAPAEMENRFMNNLENEVGSSGIDYLIINHMEPDHSGLISEIRERYDVTVVCTDKGKDLLESLYGMEGGVRVVSQGDTLDLGHKTVKFIETPFVHWPETMMTYLEEEKILFSGDAFGTFGSLSDKLFDDEVELEHFKNEGRRYFSNVIGTYTSATKAAIGKVKELDIDVLSPSHGPVWRDDPQKIIDLYDRWCDMEGEGVLIV
ncbi:MAG: FprA family A-type flavoprotein, partial [Candidatus Aenigmatarchaeota archaeon]